MIFRQFLKILEGFWVIFYQFLQIFEGFGVNFSVIFYQLLPQVTFKSQISSDQPGTFGSSFSGFWEEFGLIFVTMFRRIVPRRPNGFATSMRPVASMCLKG